MGDDITIGVTEIVNNIEVTAQPNDQVIDIEVIDNSDDVTLNVTPNVIEVNINKGSSYARWGSIFGNLTDQTDLTNALFNKADLVDGKVPAYQLPSFVDDVIEVANFAALPTVGEIGKIYVTLDNNKIYRWSGSIYIEIAANQAVWGSITGTLSNQTDLQNALNLKANDNEVVKLAGSQTITGEKTFSAIRTNVNGTLVVKSGIPTGVSFSSFTLNHLTLGITNAGTTYNQNLIFPSNSSNSYTFPNTSGTLALTSQLHDAVTLGVSNGLVLSGQQLSLLQASSTQTGALSSTDWTTFNNKLSSLSGAVLTTTNQSIAGIKTFTDNIVSNTFYSSKIISGGYIPDAGYSNMYSNDLMLTFNQMNAAGTAVTTFNFVYPTSNTLRTYNLPNSDGTLALTSQLHNAVTIGTANGLSLSNQVLSLGLASASANGALSSTDWTTFNNKQNAITNVINGIVTTGYVPKSTFTTSGLSTLGNSLIYDDGTNVGIGTTSPSQKLHVVGNGLVEGVILYRNGVTNILNVGGDQNMYGGTNSDGGVFVYGNNKLHLSTNSSRRLTVDGSGRVGISTTSPGYKLDVSTISGENYIRVDSALNQDCGYRFSENGVNKWLMYNVAASDAFAIYDNTNTSERMRITSGGNVGIGNTGSAWGSGFLGLDLGGSTASNISGGVRTRILTNLFYNGTNHIYKSTSGGLGYFQDATNSTHTWFTSPSGTEGATATLTERMRITSAGNVGIGTTSPSYKLHNTGDTFSTNYLMNRGGGLWNIIPSSGANELYFREDTGGNIRMTILGSGNLGIGTTSPTSKLQVVGLPSYADNTTAIAGGLTVGAFYHTAGVLKVVI